MVLLLEGQDAYSQFIGILACKLFLESPKHAHFLLQHGAKEALDRVFADKPAISRGLNIASMAVQEKLALLMAVRNWTGNPVPQIPGLSPSNIMQPAMVEKMFAGYLGQQESFLSKAFKGLTFDLFATDLISPTQLLDAKFMSWFKGKEHDPLVYQRAISAAQFGLARWETDLKMTVTMSYGDESKALILSSLDPLFSQRDMLKVRFVIDRPGPMSLAEGTSYDIHVELVYPIAMGLFLAQNSAALGGNLFDLEQASWSHITAFDMTGEGHDRMMFDLQHLQIQLKHRSKLIPVDPNLSFAQQLKDLVLRPSEPLSHLFRYEPFVFTVSYCDYEPKLPAPGPLKPLSLNSNFQAMLAVLDHLKDTGRIEDARGLENWRIDRKTEIQFQEAMLVYERKWPAWISSLIHSHPHLFTYYSKYDHLVYSHFGTLRALDHLLVMHGGFNTGADVMYQRMPTIALRVDRERMVETGTRALRLASYLPQVHYEFGFDGDQAGGQVQFKCPFSCSYE